MGSKKPSARAKQVAAFKAHLDDFGGVDDLFAREGARREHAAEEHEAALRKKACESKNRYVTRAEAEEAIAACAAYGRAGLHCYRCDYCGGWHLTHKPPRSASRGRI